MHCDLNRLRFRHVIRRRRRRLVIEVLAHRVSRVDIGRDHLPMDDTGFVAQQERIHAFHADR
ncbi:MAG: hypothetical protein ACXWAX_10230, partial [Chthoniobacterales bacterium]